MLDYPEFIPLPSRGEMNSMIKLLQNYLEGPFRVPSRFAEEHDNKLPGYEFLRNEGSEALFRWIPLDG